MPAPLLLLFLKYFPRQPKVGEEVTCYRPNGTWFRAEITLVKGENVYIRRYLANHIPTDTPKEYKIKKADLTAGPARDTWDYRFKPLV